MTTGQDKSQLSTNDFPMHVEEEEEEEFEQEGIPFDETGDFQPIDSSLISGDGLNVAGTNNKRKSDTMDGLELGLSNDITQEEEEEAKQQEQSQPEGQVPGKKKDSKEKKQCQRSSTPS
jgi:hypothetical protein